MINKKKKIYITFFKHIIYSIMTNIMKGESEHQLPKLKLILHEYPLTVIHRTDLIVCKELRIHELQIKFYI